MYKSILAATVVVLVLSLSTLTQAATYGGGSGTTEDPYQIWTPQQMNDIGANSGDWGKCFKLMANIDMSAYADTLYNIIGNQDNHFSGTFDGNSHIISNLSILVSTADYVGLFGCLGDGACIQNLGAENVSIAGHSYVGGICGSNNGIICLSYTTGSVAGTMSNIGGLCGWNCGTIDENYSYSRVQGYWFGTGGLVGLNDGIINRSYATGPISGYNYFTGGLCGFNRGVINQCYATSGFVMGKNTVGGLVGANANGGEINQSYSTGEVGGENSGGLCGSVQNNDDSPVTSCFWDTQTSGKTESDGGTGKTTTHMKTLSTFTNAGWDFSTSDGDPADWQMPSNDYPHLAGRYSGGNGTSGNPYQIANIADFQQLAATPTDWYKAFILTADIDLIGLTFTKAPIAPDISTDTDFQGTYFSGVFDGNGHLISNLTISTSTNDFIGLFGFIRNDGLVKNLGVEYVNIVGNRYVGGLAGVCEGTVKACYASGSVSGSEVAGGLIGYNWNGGLIIFCYASGSVSSNSKVGGLLGWNEYSSARYCYSTCLVSGDNISGGLAGDNNFGTLTACFFDIVASGQGTDGVGSGTSTGVTGKLTSEMKTLSTFTSAEWDFSTSDGDPADWQMPYNNYPRLSWETNLSTYSGGKGTTKNPYQIANISDFQQLSATPTDWDKSFILTADIDLIGLTYTQAPIAPNTNSSGQFTGIFDGNRHTIFNLTIDTSTEDCIGLFGFVGPGGQIRNLGIEKVEITGHESVGGLVGWNCGTLTRCHVTGIVTGSIYVGGLVGMNRMGTITLCYSTALVRGTDCVGGLVGFVWDENGELTNCYASGSVIGIGIDSGGLVGVNDGSVYNCYATGSVSGKGSNEGAGGLVGFNEGILTNCYATGSVSGVSHIGGLVGRSTYSWGTNITSCFWDIQTSDLTTSDGGIGRKTSQMKTLLTFADAGWDFDGETTNGTDDIWTITEGISYPLFALPQMRNLFDVTKCAVVSGSKEKTDQISFNGTTKVVTKDLLGVDNIIINVNSENMVNPCILTLPINNSTFQKEKYNAKTSKLSFNLDCKTGKTSFSLKKVSLAGLACPITVKITIGDYSADTILDEAIVNGSKPCPIQLLQGVKNTLDVAKSSFKKGKTAGMDSLTVSGTFTIAADYIKAPLSVMVGNQTFTVPFDKMGDKNNVASCNAKTTGGITAKLDYNKCTFTISIKNADITQSGTIPFGIDCFGVSLEGMATINIK